MMLRKSLNFSAITLAGLFLYTVVGEAAQTTTISSGARAAIDRTLSIQSVQVLPVGADGRGSATFQIKNISQKTIVALGYDATITYADGSTRSDGSRSIDLLPLYFEQSNLSIPRTAAERKPLLRAGETYVDSGMAIPFTLDDSKGLPVLVEPLVNMVIFDDGTAFGDTREVRKIRNSRQATIEEISALIEDLKYVAQADDIHKAAATRRGEMLSGQVKDAKGNPFGITIFTDTKGNQTGKSDWRQAWAAHFAGALMNANGDKLRINEQVARHQRYLQTLQQHSAITEVNQ